MASDVAFTVGQHHPICQDYGLAGRTPDRTKRGGPASREWAVVCDGCSSEPHTDVGARLLAHAAASQIGYMGEIDNFGFDVTTAWLRSCVNIAKPPLLGIGLPLSALYATLLAVTETENHNYRVVVGGDGFVVARSRDRSHLMVHRLRFRHEAPLYPAYLTEPENLAWYLQCGYGTAEVTYASVERGKPLEWVKYDWPAEIRPFAITLNASEFDCVAVMSDGAEAVRDEEGFPADLSEQLLDLCDWKGLHGGFVQRRFNRVVAGYRKKDWRLGDDLAVGAVSLPDPNDPNADPLETSR
jgi:hypothetical protein